MAWDPHVYERFASPRLRPGLELLSAITHPHPRLIVDLGCGTGSLTVHLQRRWPRATVIGVDRDPAMLAEARRRSSSVEWREGDVRSWTFEELPDVIYSNAVLHWLDDHPRLFSRLVSALPAGGVLAVQMPRNHDRPSHTEIQAVATQGPWRDRLMPLIRPEPVSPPDRYIELLRTMGTEVEAWETEYYHLLSGGDPVLAWVQGSVLRPLLAVLEPSERASFTEQLATRYRLAYPPGPDGITVFPFRRLFLVSTAV